MYDGVPRTEPACDRSGVVRAAPGRGDDRLVAGDLAGRGVVDDAAAGQDLGQAPVHHLDLAEAADHHVRRLQVAVDHPAGVGVGHRLGDRLEDREEPGQVRRPGRSRSASRSARVWPLTSFIAKNGRRSAKVPSS